ncbi:MAG TPA: CHY zinc finger protein [Caulobacteraceae bacterium]|nr:CHY zinc finger protein [Caulobacteraceae bacterium]
MAPERRPDVVGLDLDDQARCRHYATRLDIVAIRMRCCGVYYACKDCHEALAGHAIEVWPAAEWDRPAVLCGACAHEMSVRQYLDCGDRCPACGAPFNPGCRTHHHFYFDLDRARSAR